MRKDDQAAPHVEMNPSSEVKVEDADREREKEDHRAQLEF